MSSLKRFLGVGVDFFRFYPYLGPQSVQLRGCFFPGGCGTGRGGTGSFEVQATSVSVDLLLRLPLLTSADAPQGRVQPYVAVGPPLFITTLTPRNTRNLRNQDGDTDYSLGIKAAAGVAVQVYKNLAVFGEYRRAMAECVGWYPVLPSLPRYSQTTRSLVVPWVCTDALPQKGQ